MEYKSVEEVSSKFSSLGIHSEIDCSAANADLAKSIILSFDSKKLFHVTFPLVDEFDSDYSIISIERVNVDMPGQIYPLNDFVEMGFDGIRDFLDK